MYTNWKLENLYIYNYVHMSLPDYLSDIFTFTHDIHIQEIRQILHICPFTSLTVKSSNSFFYVKVHCYGTEFRLPSSIKNLKGFALSLKTIVVKGYEELGEAY